ncbi:MAG TPA: YdcH family protein [Paracoccaceae bacterium]|uniref:YdcH family protein n=1 Tax=Hydrogenophaga sp. TaxID=1904254 RepID=UPI002CBA89BA|nr:YdcH family protein [Hydrogenophaga sp.]HMO06090.1 YdcH family protein [Paracoccaceae bacterium]HMP10653.1 YdcH family protein [Hydrogenophaga sp.]
MFPEYRDLITRLKGHDHHFTRLFDKHNELDQTIKNMEAHIQPGSQVEIENLKKEKLHLKDQLYVILRKAAEEKA